MDLIMSLLKGFLVSVIWGVVFLVLAIVFLPESIFSRLLKKIKPDYVSRSIVLIRVRTIVDYLLNRKEIVVEESSASRNRSNQLKMAHLIKEKAILENNVFFLDLLKSLATMTRFSVIQAGYGEPMVCSILQQSMEYLQYYASEIINGESIGNQSERITLAADRLKRQVADTASFLESDVGEGKLQTAQNVLKHDIQSFDAFMKSEYESACAQLSRVNQLLADLFMEHVECGL
jgi:hypothetical protein